MQDCYVLRHGSLSQWRYNNLDTYKVKQIQFSCLIHIYLNHLVKWKLFWLSFDFIKIYEIMKAWYSSFNFTFQHPYPL